MPLTPFAKISLSTFDWVTVVGYLLLTAGIAAWTQIRARRTTEHYFLADRSQNWLIVAVTLFAAMFSSISFVAVPGEAFGHGMLLSLPLLLIPFLTPLSIYLFLRFFFMHRTFTAYEYLERRFNAPTRVIGSLIFCLTKLIYAGVVFYAAAKLFESLVGWSPMKTILSIGLFTIAYTVYGGMLAVIATDVMQAIVLVVGIAAVLYKLLAMSGFNVVEIYQFAAAHGHGYEAAFTREFYRFDLHDRYSFWVLAMSLAVVTLSSLNVDQLVIQRLLTSKGYKGAKRSVLVSAFGAVPLVLMFWAVGLGLFYFYSKQPEKLPTNIQADHVMGYFIGTELPAPIPGLIVAALLAALMSTISSVVNSVASVIYRDGLIRIGWLREGNRYEMLVCKVLSILAGFAALAVAGGLVLAGEGVRSTVLEVNAIWCSVGGALIGAFVLGVLVPYVSGRAMLVGMLIGVAIGLTLPTMLYYRVPADQRISFAWLGVPVILASFVFPLLLSLIWPNRKDLKGLTLWTIDRQEMKRLLAADSSHMHQGAPVEAEFQAAREADLVAASKK